MLRSMHSFINITCLQSEFLKDILLPIHLVVDIINAIYAAIINRSLKKSSFKKTSRNFVNFKWYTLCIIQVVTQEKCTC